MTEAEAINILQLNTPFVASKEANKAVEVAIKALEKQIAKPVKELNDRKDLYVASCTVCGYLVYRNQRYCDGCGQKLDWNEV
jgi:uncharacterized OB-fold protein